MSAAKHTPGPWQQHSLMVSEAGQRPGQHRDICHCGIGMRGDPYESEANARLIAMAPTMLEALVECAGALQGVSKALREQEGFSKSAEKLEEIALAAMLVMAEATGSTTHG